MAEGRIGSCRGRWVLPVAGALGVALAFFGTGVLAGTPGEHWQGWLRWAALGVSLGIAAGLWAMLRLAERKQWPAEKVFLLLFVPLSLLMMAVLPLNRAPDEEYHLLRIWQFSIGQWFPTAQNQGIFYQPVNLNDVWGYRNSEISLWQLATLADPVLDTSRYIVSNVETNTGVYPVNNYLPQAFGVWLFRMFTDNRVLMLYGARLGAWAVTVWLSWYAVKKLPYGKYSFIAISLLPTSLQEAASASADGMTVAAVVAFLALFLELRTHPRRLTPGEKGMLIFLTISAATLKILYAPLVFLLLFLPRECFGSKKEKNITSWALILGSLAVVVGWLLLCKMLYIDDAAASETKDGNVMPQILYILQHPVRYLLTVAKTFVLKSYNYGGGMVGIQLSWYNVFLPYSLTALVVAAVIGVFLTDREMEGQRLTALRHQLWWTAVVSVLVIFTSLYIWWNPYGNNMVNGVQGRYFTPLLLPVVMALRGNWGKLTGEKTCFRLTGALGLMNVGVLLSIFIQVLG